MIETRPASSGTLPAPRGPPPAPLLPRVGLRTSVRRAPGSRQPCRSRCRDAARDRAWGAGPRGRARRSALGALLSQEALELARDRVAARQVGGAELGRLLARGLLEALDERLHLGVGLH